MAQEHIVRDADAAEHAGMNHTDNSVDPSHVEGAFMERDWDIPLSGEEVVVRLSVKGVEEVRIRKDMATQTETFTDTVRREQVVVEGVDPEGHAITPMA